MKDIKINYFKFNNKTYIDGVIDARCFNNYTYNFNLPLFESVDVNSIIMQSTPTQLSQRYREYTFFQINSGGTIEKCPIYFFMAINAILSIVTFTGFYWAMCYLLDKFDKKNDYTLKLEFAKITSNLEAIDENSSEDMIDEFFENLFLTYCQGETTKTKLLFGHYYITLIGEEKKDLQETMKARLLRTLY
ncbi:MAG: hypothetical protein WDZ28_05970 [Simkaniaceae bacterium]